MRVVDQFLRLSQLEVKHYTEPGHTVPVSKMIPARIAEEGPVEPIVPSHPRPPKSVRQDHNCKRKDQGERKVSAHPIQQTIGLRR